MDFPPFQYANWIREDWDENLGARLGDVTTLVAPRNAVQATDLTARGCEVLFAIARGHKNRQIAEKLCISPRTVERHVQNIYTKLNVHNRVEAANWAHEHGVV